MNTSSILKVHALLNVTPLICFLFVKDVVENIRTFPATGIRGSLPMKGFCEDLARFGYDSIRAMIEMGIVY